MTACCQRRCYLYSYIHQRKISHPRLSYLPLSFVLTSVLQLFIQSPDYNSTALFVLDAQLYWDYSRAVEQSHILFVRHLLFPTNIGYPLTVCSTYINSLIHDSMMFLAFVTSSVAATCSIKLCSDARRWISTRLLVLCDYSHWQLTWLGSDTTTGRHIMSHTMWDFVRTQVGHRNKRRLAGAESSYSLNSIIVISHISPRRCHLWCRNAIVSNQLRKCQIFIQKRKQTNVDASLTWASHKQLKTLIQRQRFNSLPRCVRKGDWVLLKLKINEQLVLLRNMEQWNGEATSGGDMMRAPHDRWSVAQV